MRELIGLAGAALFAASCAQAAPASGRFEQLDVAVAGDGTLTASYREDQGVGVVKSCAFQLSGKLDRSGRGTVKAWADRSRVLTGTIAVRDDAAVLSVPGARSFPGCGMVLLPEIDKGIELTKTDPAAWQSLARITAPRTMLRPTPTSPPKRAYLVQRDIVGVTGQQGNMLAVEFHSAEGRTSKGWVLASDTAALLPPR